MGIRYSIRMHRYPLAPPRAIPLRPRSRPARRETLGRGLDLDDHLVARLVIHGSRIMLRTAWRLPRLRFESIGMACTIVLVEHIARVEDSLAAIGCTDEPTALQTNDKLWRRAIVPRIFSNLLCDDEIGDTKIVRGLRERSHVLKDAGIRIRFGNDCACEV